MRSVLYYRHGAPAEVLDTAEVENPSSPPPGHVLVRVRTRPVHYGDLLGIAGRYRTGDDRSVPANGNRLGTLVGRSALDFTLSGADRQLPPSGCVGLAERRMSGSPPNHKDS